MHDLHLRPGCLPTSCVTFTQGWQANKGSFLPPHPVNTSGGPWVSELQGRLSEVLVDLPVWLGEFLDVSLTKKVLMALSSC